MDAAGLRGTVVNVGSVVDRSPSPVHFGTLAYAASKGARPVRYDLGSGGGTLRIGSGLTCSRPD